MNNAFVVEAKGQTAGIAVRDGNGFEFFAAGDRYLELDRRRFRTLREIERRLIELDGGRGSPRF